MKCFNHHDRDAFGISLVTGKALCLECMEEYKGIIIEKDNEFSKQAAEKLIIGYKQINASSSAMKIWYWVFAGSGCALVLTSIATFIASDIVGGILLFIFGFLTLAISWGYKKYIK